MDLPLLRDVYKYLEVFPRLHWSLLVPAFQRPFKPPCSGLTDWYNPRIEGAPFFFFSSSLLVCLTRSFAPELLSPRHPRARRRFSALSSTRVFPIGNKLNGR